MQVNAVDFLLAVDDGGLMEALCCRDEAVVFQHFAEGGRRTTPPLVEFKQLIGASHATLVVYVALEHFGLT